MIRSIFALTVITLSSLFVVFYVVPLYKQAGERAKDINTINLAAENTEELESLIRTASTTMDAFSRTQNDERLKVFLPEVIDPFRLANDIKYIGLRNNLALSDIKVEEKTGDSSIQKASGNAPLTASGEEPSLTETSKSYVATKVSFTAVATDAVFKGLLSDIETSLGLMNVTSLSFQEYVDAGRTKDSKLAANTPPFYKYSVELETYSLK